MTQSAYPHIKKIHSSLKECIEEYRLQDKRWYLAFSGGVDSMVLLNALTHVTHLCNEREKKLITILHVNHQLSQNALAWENHAKSVIDEYRNYGFNLDLKIIQVTCDVQKMCVEEAAREARYQAFEGILDTNSVLFTGHHANDQVETVLFRLFRGTGINGLKGMPVYRALGKGELFRPLLDVKRESIEHYAKAIELPFVTDESNEDQRFDRNFIRHSIVPSIVSRWSQFMGSIEKLKHDVEETQSLLNEMAESDLELIENKKEQCINQVLLMQLSLARQKNVLRYWLQTMLKKDIPMSHIAYLVNEINKEIKNTSKHRFLTKKGIELVSNNKKIWIKKDS